MEYFCQPRDLSEIKFGKFEIEDDYIYFNLIEASGNAGCCSSKTEEKGLSIHGIEADSWRIADNPILCTIRNHFDEFLAAKDLEPDGVIAVFIGPQSPQGQTTFSLEKYIAWPPEKGISVAFTVSVNKEMWYMSCTENKEITFKKGQCPSQIQGDTSDVIFIFKDFSAGHGDSYKFESSRHRNYFLAMNSETDRLYLKRPSDEVDESIKLKVSQV